MLEGVTSEEEIADFWAVLNWRGSEMELSAPEDFSESLPKVNNFFNSIADDDLAGTGLPILIEGPLMPDMDYFFCLY